jgi:outer membrane protein
MTVNNKFFAALSLGLAIAAYPAIGQTAPPAAAATPAPAPTKVGVINVQDAITQTKDGQKALADLRAKFSPKQSELEKKQQDVASLQQQLSKGQNTMSDESKQKLMREIDAKNTLLKRDTEDANADLEQENQRLMNDLGGKVMATINKFATDNGYALVVDISSQQTPVMFASSSIDITRDIIALYDKSAPNFAAPSGPKTATPQPKPTQPQAPIKKQ